MVTFNTYSYHFNNNLEKYPNEILNLFILFYSASRVYYCSVARTSNEETKI